MGIQLGISIGGGAAIAPPIRLTEYTASPFAAQADAPDGEVWIAGPVTIRVPSVEGTEGYNQAPEAGGIRLVAGAITASGAITEDESGDVQTAIQRGGWADGETPTLTVTGAQTVRQFATIGGTTYQRLFGATGTPITSATGTPLYGAI